jgi:very-short-patch-repair endonuclease
MARNELDAVLLTATGRATKGLRAILNGPDAPTRSRLEDRFLTLVAQAGLPRPEVNQKVRGYEVDALWRGERLIAELDGYRFHSSRSAFETDRARDARLQAAGYRVVRITWRQLTKEPEVMKTLLRRLLAGAA